MDEQQRHVLDAMGIQVWELRSEEGVQSGVPADPEPSTLNPEFDHHAQDSLFAAKGEHAAKVSMERLPVDLEPADIAILDWDALRQRVQECSRCPELVANRTQTVFGVGNVQADCLVIGEAPGAEEDRQGEPFVGRAGQLLTAMLASIGLGREQVYIANVLKCRPPNNRDPKPEEAQACSAYLQGQIALIQPKFILVVGRIAAQNLLGTDDPIGKLRGHVHRLDSGVPVVATYHPAYLLRSPQDKRKAWADLCLARSMLFTPLSGAGA